MILVRHLPQLLCVPGRMPIKMVSYKKRLQFSEVIQAMATQEKGT